jgi:hypothetical protein
VHVQAGQLHACRHIAAPVARDHARATNVLRRGEQAADDLRAVRVPAQQGGQQLRQMVVDTWPSPHLQDLLRHVVPLAA